MALRNELFTGTFANKKIKELGLDRIEVTDANTSALLLLAKKAIVGLSMTLDSEDPFADMDEVAETMMAISHWANSINPKE
jgi:hypothetical protein